MFITIVRLTRPLCVNLTESRITIENVDVAEVLVNLLFRIGPILTGHRLGLCIVLLRFRLLLLWRLFFVLELLVHIAFHSITIGGRV